MKQKPVHEPGRDAAAIEVDGEGVVRTTWSDGTQTEVASVSLRVRIRAQGNATHAFLTKGRRRWPEPRV